MLEGTLVAVAPPLPEPMLARSGPLPAGPGWRFEPKLDGFRCVTCTHGGRLRIRSRRGWDMTLLVPELAELPADVQLDGELIAWGDDNNPDFHRLSRRMLHGDRSIRVSYMAFDVVALDGEPTLRLPYAERHALLEEIVLDTPPALVEVIASFEDGPALWDVIVASGMEGGGAKREREPYRPGARTWVKTKNRATARFQEELSGARRALRHRG
jgi:bifunctional non-homologous end joining protein LigD